MQYLLIFAAVLIVVLCMNVFIFTALRQTASRMKDQLDSRYIRELSAYDRLYEQKTKKLEEIREQEALMNSNIFKKQENEPKQSEIRTSVRSGGDIPVSRTADMDFAKEYRYVKQAFTMDPAAEVKKVADLPQNPYEAELSGKTKAAERILKEISADNAVSMATLSSDDQLKLLNEILSGSDHDSEIALLIDYLKDTADENGDVDFSILDFYSYIQSLCRSYCGGVTVYTGEQKPEPVKGADRTIYDESICEGFRIVRGNRVYDYSL